MPGAIKYCLSTVPPGFPAALSGLMVWDKTTFDKAQDYVLEFSEEEISEIERALKLFKESKVSAHHINKDNFPLSDRFSLKLGSAGTIVHNGRGFIILRGLNPTDYTEEENVLIYGGLSSHMCEERADMIHIRDRARGVQSSETAARFPPNEVTTAMDFHTDVDAGDVLSLYTIGLSRSGGRQFLSSFWTVYNQLASEHPDVLATLTGDWRYEMPTMGEPEVIERPVVTCVDGNVQINFATAFLLGSLFVPRLPDGPKPTDAQLHAIDILLKVAWEHSVPIQQKLGDILLVNNLSILHAREKFENDTSSGLQRHVLSLMLRDPLMAWPKTKKVAKRIDKKFVKLDQPGTMEKPEFFGTMRDYEDHRSKFKMLRHD